MPGLGAMAAKKLETPTVTPNYEGSVVLCGCQREPPTTQLPLPGHTSAALPPQAPLVSTRPTPWPPSGSRVRLDPAPGLAT